MENLRRVYALSTTSAGADIVRIISDKIQLAGIIGLDAVYKSNHVAGYVDMSQLALELGIRFIPVEKYELDGSDDALRLQEEMIDVLLVVGWQRLIPNWLINHCSEGALGIHGGPDGISASRGRSPQNWALLLGASEFKLSLFCLDDGVDSGNIISSTSFHYDEGDDINVSYLKVAISSSKLIIQALKSGEDLFSLSRPQTGDVYYFPKRLPEDGAIDWSRSSADICRFVSALTHPYPGAFSLLGDSKIFIWKARLLSKFQNNFPEDEPAAIPGEVIFQSTSGLIVIRTGDGYIMSESWGLDSGALFNGISGKVLSSSNWQEQLRRILSRHETKHPGYKISPLLLEQITDRKSQA